MLHAKNDSKRLKDELKELKNKNKPLLDLLVDLYHWVDNNFKKDVIITMIYRTQEEQDKIYKGLKRSDGREYDKRPWRSPHQFWVAADIRSKIYSSSEIEKIENYLNNKYNSSNYFKWTAKNHKVGNGAFHFHIQYSKK